MLRETVIKLKSDMIIEGIPYRAGAVVKVSDAFALESINEGTGERPVMPQTVSIKRGKGKTKKPKKKS